MHKIGASDSALLVTLCALQITILLLLLLLSVGSFGEQENLMYQQQSLVDVDGDHPDGEMVTGTVFDVQRHVIVVVV